MGDPLGLVNDRVAREYLGLVAQKRGLMAGLQVCTPEDVDRMASDLGAAPTLLKEGRDLSKTEMIAGCDVTRVEGGVRFTASAMSKRQRKVWYNVAITYNGSKISYHSCECKLGKEMQPLV